MTTRLTGRSSSPGNLLSETSRSTLHGCAVHAQGRSARRGPRLRSSSVALAGRTPPFATPGCNVPPADARACCLGPGTAGQRSPSPVPGPRAGHPVPPAGTDSQEAAKTRLELSRPRRGGAACACTTAVRSRCRSNRRWPTWRPPPPGWCRGVRQPWPRCTGAWR